MLSLAALARRLDLPYSRAAKLREAGALVPDLVIGSNVTLFSETRVPELRRAAALARKRRGRG